MTSAPPLPYRLLIARGMVALVCALIGTLGLLWTVTTWAVVSPYGPLTYPPVTGVTIMVTIAATAVYGALTRLWPAPDRVFIRVAGIVLVVSWLPDISMLRHDPEATVGAVLVLMLMNVIVAGICVAVLTDRYSPISR